MSRFSRLAALASCLIACPALAGLDARMMRRPDVSATQVAFVHAGDIWVVPKEGGVAQRLSTPDGEEAFPRFSPDGKMLAFSANYDGNVDVHVMPVTGGVARRLTQHPVNERLVDWAPDGSAVLFVSSRDSGSGRFNQFHLMPLQRSEPRKLPIPYGEFGALSPDGKTLAYTPQGQDFATWKRYRGGMESRIWLFGLEDGRSQLLGDGTAKESQPMWHGRTLYYVSDRGEGLRSNLWARDLDTGVARQVTRFTDQDVHFPAIGPSDIVFEQAGRLWRLELPSERLVEVPVEVITDRATLRPRAEKVGDRIANASVSPSGKRAVFEARGEIFSVPAEDGAVLNLTRSSGSAERTPAWSPDGKTIAFWSDASGEYELYLTPADGSGASRKLTSLGRGFRYRPSWSPDSKRLAFIDQTGSIFIADAASGATKKIDKGDYLTEDGLRGFSPAWSADGRWMTYSKTIARLSDAIFLYDTKTGALTQATSGFYSDTNPVFDPKGEYLYHVSVRTHAPLYAQGGADNTWIYANGMNLVAVPLRADVPSPLAPRNDVEGEDDDEDEDEAAAKQDGHAKKSKGARDQPARKADKSVKGEKTAKEKKKEEPPPPVEIALGGFEQRGVILPVPPGTYGDLAAVEGKLLFHELARVGSPEDEPEPLKAWLAEDREVKTILDDAGDVIVAAKGEKALVSVEDGWAIIDLEPDQEIEKKLPTDDMEMMLDPVAEWHQMFDDAWRIERDFFYDPNMHGVDWTAMRVRYGALVDDCVTRWDLNFVLGELIGELNSSHAYRGGGDTEQAPSRPAGLLGCEFALEQGAWRVARIVRGADWDLQPRSPLQEPGAQVQAGEWILAVNGQPLDPTREPWAALEGLAGKTVALTVSPTPNSSHARVVVAKTLTLQEDARLRYLEWVERMRRRVAQRTQGRVAYVHVPDTGEEGQSELYRQLMGQLGAEGLIIDERFNSGGQIPDRFIELLDRPVLNYWAVRDGKDWRWPPSSLPGPKVMLVNGWSGSGGDCFPLYFREKGLGPIIGMRTWGGLIGMSGSPDLVDGGTVTVPTFSIYSKTGQWIVENRGVEPDIEVIDDPALMKDGGDPQLDRAIDEVLAALARAPHVDPPRPIPPRR